MKPKRTDWVDQFLTQARHSLVEHHLPRILQCLKRLPNEDIWWRPHLTSNSVGNLVLHLSGNVRQWIISGLGGEPDHRERDKEFADRGSLLRPTLAARLRSTVAEAGEVLEGMGSRELKRVYSIQGFRVTGFQAVAHVVEHFAYHTGQIIFVAKQKLGRDLGFTRLREEKKQGRRRSLSQV